MTRSELKSIIKECYNEIKNDNISISESMDDSYYSIIKKDEQKIRRVVNKISKENFKKYIEYSIKQEEDEIKNNDPKYLTYHQNHIEEYKKFEKEQKSGPVVNRFDYDFSDIVCFYFTGKFPSHDILLFYQDYIAKLLNKSELSNKYYFSTEDYEGIFIELK